MKKGWKFKTLGDVVSFQRGLTYSKKDEVDFSSNIVLRANNIDLKTNKLDFSELKYINDNITIPKEKKVSKWSLIICTASGSKSHLGKVALVDNNYDYAFGGFMGQLNPSDEIDSRYLFYLLISDGYKTFISRLSDGVNINNLRFDNLSEFPISLPPLSEQKRIVKILDEIFEKTVKVKENTEKNLQNARKLLESYLHNIFDKPDKNWVENKFGKICDFVRGPFGGSLKKTCFKPSGIAVYEQQHAIYDQFEDIRYYIDNEKFNEMKRFELLPGDLIMSCSGTMGKVAIVPDNIHKGIINQALLKLSPNKNINAKYLKIWMGSANFQEQLAKHTQGVAIKNVASVKVIKEIDVPVPSVSKQNYIIDMLENFSAKTKKLEAIYQQKLTDLQELKKSILQKAFNGELAGARS